MLVLTIHAKGSPKAIAPAITATYRAVRFKMCEILLGLALLGAARCGLLAVAVVMILNPLVVHPKRGAPQAYQYEKENDKKQQCRLS